MENNNDIHESAIIHPTVKLGSYNRIGRNVRIEITGVPERSIISIGDNNIINDNTRILIKGDLTIGDWNVFHNDILIMAEDKMKIGHNCWFGQNTILDGTGGLIIGNGVRVGMYSQIWTHVASGERIEGCTLFAKRETIINDDVWLVGSCIVGSGIELGYKSIILINSVVTKNTLPNKTYSGTPAKLMEGLEFYKPITLEEKVIMLKNWLNEFCIENDKFYKLEHFNNELILFDDLGKEKVIFTYVENKEYDKSQSIFFLHNKTFNKTNSTLERIIYKYLYNNKARFLPI